jgi:hypothetical protein
VLRVSILLAAIFSIFYAALIFLWFVSLHQGKEMNNQPIMQCEKSLHCFSALIIRVYLSFTGISIDKVKNELYDKNDELEKWCKANLPDDFFKSSASVISEYQKVSA